MTDVDITAILREQEARQAAELVAQVKNAAPVLDDIEITREYELGADVILRATGPLDNERITGILTRVRVTKTIPTSPTDDGEAPEAFYSARGYFTPYTAKGKPSKSERPHWIYLQDGVARELLKDETLDIDTSSSASRQHYIDTGRYLTTAEVAEYAS